MTLVQVTVNLAFHDVLGVHAESIKNHIIEQALDVLEAEVVFLSDTKERKVAVPDPDVDLDNADEQIEAWQERARKELSVQPPDNTPARLLVPVLYEMEPIGVGGALEASIVHWFCSEQCRRVFELDAPVESGENGDFARGTQCEECGKVVHA